MATAMQGRTGWTCQSTISRSICSTPLLLAPRQMIDFVDLCFADVRHVLCVHSILWLRTTFFSVLPPTHTLPNRIYYDHRPTQVEHDPQSVYSPPIASPTPKRAHLINIYYPTSTAFSFLHLYKRGSPHQLPTFRGMR